MKTIKLLLIGVALSALVFTSCSKEDDPVTPAPTPITPATTGTAMMHLHSSWGMMSSNFYLDTVYTLASTVTGVPARQIKISDARFYVSKVSFDNNTLGAYLLVSPANMMYNLGSASPGTFTNLSFNVGLDSTTNHSDPMTAAAPLNETSMHWNWNTSAGYKFIRLEGQIDSSLTGLAGEWKNFVYHVATDATLRNVSYSQNNSITVGQTTTVNYHIMWNRFFDGVDVATNSNQHGGGTTNTAIANNTQMVFMPMP